MRRILIFICLTILTVIVPLSLGGTPGQKVRMLKAQLNEIPKVRITEDSVSQKPVVPSGSVAVTVQVLPAPPLPLRFALEQNYPNPYNSTTIISYGCGQDGFVSLKVYNILGQEVATLVEEYKKAGFYTVQWDSQDRYGNSLASGIYFYRMIAGQFVRSKKLVLVR